MRILIETKNLIDFPYTPELKSVFHFDNEKVEGLACEILYGWPTCYLVSGYRGAGKTSFIKKVEEKCKEQNARDEKSQNLLFVYSNFSRFDTGTNFLRKIIRDLKETVLGEIKHADKTLTEDIDDLYKKTFYAVKEEHSKAEETETSTEFSIDVKDFIRKIIKALLPLLFTTIIGPVLSFFKDFQFVENYGPVINIFLIAGLIALAFFQTVKISAAYKVKVSEKTGNSESSLTDDDIINYYLERLIAKFKDSDYRLIFVLDELDKLKDDEMDGLLKEMKPWLVRGKADFIIVAGQKLTMKYYQMRDGDDELLASLFSKVVHVNLLAEYHFENIFNNQLFKGISLNNTDPFVKKSFAEVTGTPSIAVSNFRDHYIYRSKKLPRTFMNLIRQDLRWSGQDAFLIAPNDDYDCEKKKWNILRDISEKMSFNASISETAHDYIMMYLYRISVSIDCLGNHPNIPPEVPVDYPFLKDLLIKYGNDFVDEVNAVSKKAETKENEIVNSTVIEEMHKKEVAASLENIPQQVTEKEVTVFAKDFLSFFQDLSRFYPDLFGRKTDSNVTFRVLIIEYRRAKIFLFPNIDDPIVNQSYDYYYKRQTDGETFRYLYNLFSVNSIRIGPLREAVYKEYSSKMIQKYFKGNFQSSDAMPQSIREFGQFSVRVSDSNIGTTTVLFRYQFIDGPISVSADDALRLTSYLEEFNVITNSGNYIVQILFSTDLQSDFEKEEVKAASRLKAIRPDFIDRVRFVLLPVNWADKLGERLKNLSDVLQPYRLVPVVREDVARQKPRKGSSKKNFDEKLKTTRAGAIDPEDIQKGKWGGSEVNNNRRLSARVLKAEEKDWFLVTIKVESMDANNPLTGKVTFHLHDSFDPSEITVIAKDNLADIKDLYCYEAFTVGASCDNNTTHLELDLNTLDDAPSEFKY